MNFEQLRYIVVVAESGSLLHASKKLHITQSALSQAITKVEDTLDIKIFNRSRLGTTPTDIGEDVIEKAMEILEGFQELKRIADVNHTERLRIGTVPNSLYYLPKTLATFKREYPSTTVEIEEGKSEDIIEGVVQKKIDIGIIALNEIPQDIYDKDVAVHTLFYDKMKVAVSKRSSLAFKKNVTIQDILKHPLVIYDHEQIWRFMRNIESKYGPADIIFSSNNIDSIRQMISENLAITIASEYAINKHCTGLHSKTVSIEIDGLESKYGLALVWSRKKQDKGITKKFLTKLNLQA